ncbi:CNNM domain-containing protein [Sulfobacillus harzensis]|uniref:HlyC/CorC family transporter n=1 Tax=Sulfobacillus harzensis TaxID=2729629 RepID=A0A7Y0L4V7_9FIRM|nr:HlyC/CorC family transporter [Sulfobacillus harzensis]
MRRIEWIPIVALIVVVAISALYSMAETAMMALSRGKMRTLSENHQVERLSALLRSPNRLLGTVLVGNNLANILATTLATAVFLHYWGHFGVAISTVVMTLFILLVAEITPKTFASHNAEQVALRLTPFLAVSARIFYPIVRILTWVGVGIIRLMGGKAEGGKLMTEEELRTLVEVGEEQGLLEANERDMIQGVFDFGDTVVREVMVPRIDVQALPETATLGEVWDTLVEWGHSRVPIYRNTVDDITGVIYARDILAYGREKPLDTPARDLARPIQFVPETKKLDHLFADFRRQHTQIAVVMDEYGGTAGIVTIEDLLEEIVGEIQDEYDTEEVPMRELSPGVIEVAGLFALDELNEKFDLELPHEDFDTVGGLVLHLLGRVPIEGEVVRLDNVEITVAQVVGRRVSRAILRILKPPEED